MHVFSKIFSISNKERYRKTFKEYFLRIFASGFTPTTGTRYGDYYEDYKSLISGAFKFNFWTKLGIWTNRIDPPSLSASFLKFERFGQLKKNLGLGIDVPPRPFLVQIPKRFILKLP